MISWRLVAFHKIVQLCWFAVMVLITLWGLINWFQLMVWSSNLHFIHLARWKLAFSDTFSLRNSTHRDAHFLAISSWSQFEAWFSWILWCWSVPSVIVKYMPNAEMFPFAELKYKCDHWAEVVLLGARSLSWSATCERTLFAPLLCGFCHLCREMREFLIWTVTSPGVCLLVRRASWRITRSPMMVVWVISAEKREERKAESKREEREAKWLYQNYDSVMSE